MNVGSSCILLIGKEKTSVIPKVKGREYHLHYYLEQAKKNKYLRKIIGRFDLTFLADNLAYVPETIVKALVKDGYIVLHNQAPQVLTPTNTYVGYGPKSITPYQKEKLKELESLSYHFLDFGLLNTLDEYESLMLMSDCTLKEDEFIASYLESVEVLDNVLKK